METREEHEGHDHGEHAGHDAHEGHDHGEHAAHDAHEDHDHGAHGGHDAHEDHDHGAHGGHDDHAGHDHEEHGGHDDHAGHDHAGHDHAHDLRGASRRSLIIALSLISVYMVAEVVGGVLSGSLALLADAGHMLTDAAAILMALAAMWMADKAASVERTYGYQRTEVLAALINTFALWLIAAWIAFEAYHRFLHGSDVDGWPVLFVGIGGLAVNIITAWILHRSSEHSVNVEGAFQHVIADLMGSVGVVVSAIVILTVGWSLIDPILSIVIAVLILWGTRRLIVRVLNVLLEGTPERIDVYKLCSDIEEMEGVTLIHDVHVWTITSGSEAFTAHVLVDPSYEGDFNALLTRIQDLVHSDFGIGHVTIQLEDSLAGCTEDHHVGHLVARSRA